MILLLSRPAIWGTSLLCLMAVCGPTLAADTKQQLQSTIKALTLSKEQQADLEKALGKAENALSDVQQEAIDLAKQVRAIEDKIANKNKALSALERQLAAKQAILSQHQDEVGRLIQGMIRMQRLPRQFVIAKPGNADELLRTASALDITYKALALEINDLQSQMSELKSLRATIDHGQTQLLETQSSLQAKQEVLNQTLQTRQRTYRALNRDHEATLDRVTSLSNKSANLQELIGKLADEERIFQQMGVPQSKPTAPTQPSASSPSETVEAHLAPPEPSARGTIIHRFGEKSPSGEIRGGHVLLTAPRAMVTAPQAGKVVFSGHFMDYGKMIIIQHGNGIHTVLAGFGTVTVEPGQQVKAGEPVGVMGDTPKQRELYLELRKNSKPIDPTRWIGNVGGRLAGAG